MSAQGLDQSVEAAKRALADRIHGQAKGAAAMVAKADLWRKPGLEFANALRAANGLMGDEPLARKVCSRLAALEDLAAAQGQELAEARAEIPDLESEIADLRRDLIAARAAAAATRPPPAR